MKSLLTLIAYAALVVYAIDDTRPSVTCSTDTECEAICLTDAECAAFKFEVQS